VHLGLAGLRARVGRVAARGRAGRGVLDDLDEAVRELERGLERVGEAAPVVAPHDEAVDDDAHVVILPAVERRRLGEVDDRAVDHGAHEALAAHVLEELAELALAPLHERRAHLDPRALGPREHRLGDLRRTLALHRAAAVRAVRRAGARPQEAQVVVDLGDRADRRARVVAGVLLLDRDGRREPLDDVDVGLLHQAEELARVRAQRLDVPALPLGVDRVEGERRLPTPRQPGDDRELVARDGDVDVLEVVLTGAANDERVFGHWAGGDGGGKGGTRESSPGPGRETSQRVGKSSGAGAGAPGAQLARPSRPGRGRRPPARHACPERPTPTPPASSTRPTRSSC
jgi:hypothetical protein